MITANSVLKEGNTAVITGASSGIGRSMALNCASKGMTVWMVDVDGEELDVAKQLAMAKKSESSQVGA
jgi:NAD(P)-dependent dehydrogenase (short-subunit alcohol dehydrogenase family)